MLSTFISELFEHGRVRVGHPDQELAEDDMARTTDELQRLEAVRRLEFPGEPPEFLLPVATWSAAIFYRACQAATFRDLPGERLSEFLGAPCPVAADADRHYSADLVFQFLPDLVKLTGHVSPNDPLVGILKTWTNQWPLASIGIVGVEPESLVGIVDHPFLLQHYANRVIARRDAGRLGVPVVWATVQRSLSIFSSQFPGFTPPSLPVKSS